MDDLNKEEEVMIRLDKIKDQIKDNKRSIREVSYSILRFDKIEKEQHKIMSMHSEYYR